MKALAIKGIMTIIVLYLVLGLGFGFTFGDTLLMTIVLGVISYLLDDLYVLPKWNNMIATLADFGLVMSLFLFQDNASCQSLCSSYRNGSNIHRLP